MSCHEHLSQWVGQQIDSGKIVLSSTMLHPRNDSFIVQLANGQRRKFRRWEIREQLDKLSGVVDDRHNWYQEYGDE